MSSSHEMNLNRQQLSIDLPISNWQVQLSIDLPISNWQVQLSIDLPISNWQVQLGDASGTQWAEGYEIGRILKINRME